MGTRQEREPLHERRARIRRQRITAATGAVVVVALVVGGIFFAFPTSHHVRVLHVIPSVVTKIPSPDEKGEAEYKAAAGAPSDKTVKKELTAAEHQNPSEAESSGGSSRSLLTSDAASSFEHLASSLPGQVELAVTPLGGGKREVLGGDEAAHGWSTTKVPVLVSLIRARGSEGLTSEEQSWAESAITESNNESVLSLFGDLEKLRGGLDGASAYIDGVLRDSGDNETVVATGTPPAGAVTTFGQTEWSPGEAVKFFRALANRCLLSSGQTEYVLGLMQSIEPSESWGLGSAGFSSVAFKGGWGPEDGGYLVRQSGIIDPGSSDGVAVAIVAHAPNFSAGTEMLTTTASWLHKHLGLSAHASAGCAPE